MTKYVFNAYSLEIFEDIFAILVTFIRLIFYTVIDGFHDQNAQLA